jgi:hypothetical protein
LRSKIAAVAVAVSCEGPPDDSGALTIPTDSNQALFRRYITEVWDQGNLNALDSFLSPNYQCHVSALAPPLSRDDQKQLVTSFRAAFPDIELTVDDVLSDGDRIAFRSTIRGTHLGPFRGFSPTGRRVTVGLVDIIRIQDEQFVEQWGGPDLLDLLRQITPQHSNS